MAELDLELPDPGKDRGIWGPILNAFLSAARTILNQHDDRLDTAETEIAGLAEGVIPELTDAGMAQVLATGGEFADEVSAKIVDATEGFITIPPEDGQPGQVLVKDPTTPDGLAWSSLGGGTVLQHPRGTSEEQGDNVYTGAFYGFGMQIAAPASETFNQVAVRFASSVPGENVRVRVLSNGAAATGIIDFTSATILADVTVPAALVPQGTVPKEVIVSLGQSVTVAANRWVIVVVTSTTQGALTIPRWTANTPGDRLRFYLGDTTARIVAASTSYLTVPPRLLDGHPEFIILNEQVRVAAAAAVAAEEAAESAAGSPPPRVMLPTAIHAVTGDKLQLFARSIIEATDPYAAPNVVTSGKGACFPRYYEWTPGSGDAGVDVPLTAKVYSHDGATVATDTTTLKVKAPASPSSAKRVMLIGDSTMLDTRVAEVRRRLVGSGGTPVGSGLTNIAFQGNQPITGAAGEGYFGYGGWTLAHWLGTATRVAFWLTVASHDKTPADQKAVYTDSDGKKWFIETIESGRIKMIASDGALSIPSSGNLTWSSGGATTTAIAYTAAAAAAATPFWNPAGAGSFSVKYWCDTYAGGVYPDVIELAVGLNSLTGSTGTAADFTAVAANYRTFLNAVRAEFPTVKIHLYGLCPPSPTGGLGTNYGATGLLGDYFAARRQITGYNLMLQEVAVESAFSAWTTFIDQGVQFDSEYGYPASAVAVNARSATTEQRGTNGIHPSTDGYKQLADVHYRALVHAL